MTETEMTLVIVALSEAERELLKQILPNMFDVYNLDNESEHVKEQLKITIEGLLKKIS